MQAAALRDSALKSDANIPKTEVSFLGKLVLCCAEGDND